MLTILGDVVDGDVRRACSALQPTVSLYATHNRRTAHTEAGGCPPRVSILKTCAARSPWPWTPARLSQSTFVAGLAGAGTSPVFAPTTNASAWPASLADVKSHFGDRPAPVTGFVTK